MKNVKYVIDGDKLKIEVDLTEEHGLSSSGKSIIVATSEGPFRVPGREERIGLNIYRPF
jgi:hypothetical protein